ncbi:isochorismatase family cysteine hydrolase [Lentzea sp. NPDC042327]|uniref:cysteine hydrolase family protein n=1 Tax=Lentzea sp. NPDC042327 TaxID=3154801 RepID=UPI0033F5D65D
MTSSPALLVLDLLNDIVHPDGQYASHGYEQQVASRGVLERAATAIARARAENIPVIYVVVGFSPDFSEWPSNSPVFAEAKDAGKLVIGTWATEVHDAVKPAEGDAVVVKRRISPFFGTELDLVLRTRGVNTLLLTGVSTDLVVLATARDAHDRDYAVQVLADATASATSDLHEAALRLIARTGTVTTVDEALPPR